MSSTVNWIYHPANFYEYHVCTMEPNHATSAVKDTNWVEVWFHTGSVFPWAPYTLPSAFVYDSEGNFYEVDLTIE